MIEGRGNGVYQYRVYPAASPNRFPQKTLQLRTAEWMLKLTQCFYLELSDSLAGNFEFAPDFLQGVCIPIPQAVAQLDYLALAVRECTEALLEMIFEHSVAGCACRRCGRSVRHEVTQHIP